MRSSEKIEMQSEIELWPSSAAFSPLLQWVFNQICCALIEMAKDKLFTWAAILAACNYTSSEHFGSNVANDENDEHYASYWQSSAKPSNHQILWQLLCERSPGMCWPRPRPRNRTRRCPRLGKRCEAAKRKCAARYLFYTWRGRSVGCATGHGSRKSIAHAT